MLNITNASLADQSSSTNRPTTQENPFAARHAVQMGQIGRVQEGRRFFITQGGRIGFGPSNISVGQRVCIFSWSKTAHVLDRAENDEKEQYTLIGDAYVHNMMYGEIEELKIQEQDIILV